MKYTAHNILLDNGEKTMGDQIILLADSAMWKSIEKTILSIYPDRNIRQKMRVADLGCLEGGYAVQFARLGFETLGIEAREESIKKCNHAKAGLNLPNLSFAQDDVRNLESYGKFDIVLCYGLLYHLNDPVNFLRTIRSCARILVLNTHFAETHDFRYRLGWLNKLIIGPLQKRFKRLQKKQNFRLSRICEHEGYKGRWYREWGEKEKKGKIEGMLWASYNNPESFWLRKKDLTQALHDVGFQTVFEQFNFTGDLAPHNYTEYYNRTMFVAMNLDEVLSAARKDAN